MIELIQTMLVPLSIASTVLLVLAIVNEWATRPGRDPNYVLLLSFGVWVAYLLLALTLYYDATFLVRVTGTGIVGETDNSVTRSTMSLGGQCVYSLVCILYAFRFIRHTEASKTITGEMRRDWSRRSKAQLEAERQQGRRER